MLIEAHNLQKDYPMGSINFLALQGVSLEMDNGDFTAIMGASGSGKSTLLHLLGCLDRPSQGWYRFDGLDVENLSDLELSKLRNRKIGFVFQTFNLIRQYNVMENVELPLIYAGFRREKRRASSMSIIRRVGLEDKLKHHPNDLSGGEVQRVAIARALASDPLVLLADEPTGNLDSRTGEEIMELFTSVNQDGTTILMVTHNQEVASHAKRLIEMKDGLIIRDSHVLDIPDKTPG